MLKTLKERHLFCISVALYVILSSSLWLIAPHESVAQTTTNQTTTNQTMQNQTVLQKMANATDQIDLIQDDLSAAREALHGNNSQKVFVELNDVSEKLFKMERLAGPESNAAMKELQPLQNTIDNAQDALRNKDNDKALDGINSADVELLKLRQQVPTAEEPAEE